MPRFMAILIGGGFVWAVLLAKLLILYWWLRRCQYRSGIIRLFNVLVASKLLPIMAVSGVMIAAPGDPAMLKLFATPLFIYYFFISGRALYQVFPSLGLARVAGVELVMLVLITAAASGLVYLVNVDV